MLIFWEMSLFTSFCWHFDLRGAPQENHLSFEEYLFFSLHFRENTSPCMYLTYCIKGSKQKLLRYLISKKNLVIPPCNAKCHKLFSNLPHYLLLLPITKTSNLPSQSPYQHWACIWFRTHTPWKCKWYNGIYLHII